MAELRSLPCDLTEEQIKERGEALARALIRVAEIQGEKKKVAGEFDEKIQEQNALIKKLTTEVHTGKEMRDVEVRQRRNFHLKVMESWREDTMEIVGTRPLSAHELQDNIFGDFEVTKVERTEKGAAITLQQFFDDKTKI